jgi:hypothetical protein
MNALRMLCAVVGLLVWTAEAAAQPADSGASTAPPAPKREIEISLLGAFGLGSNVDDSTVNRYGKGLGLRAGITLKAPRLYLGGSFLRFFGEEDDSGKYYTATFDAHVGYDFRLFDERLLIRPELAFGVAQAVSIQSDNAGYPLTPHLAPGLLAGLRLPPVLVSAEIRRDTVPRDWANSVTFMVGAGVVF